MGSGLQRPELRQVTKKAVLPGRAEEQRPAQALLGGVRLYSKGTGASPPRGREGGSSLALHTAGAQLCSPPAVASEDGHPWARALGVRPVPGTGKRCRPVRKAGSEHDSAEAPSEVRGRTQHGLPHF